MTNSFVFKKIHDLEGWKQHGIALAVITILMTIYFFPMLFQNQGPAAPDTVAWRGAAESIIDYNASHEDLAYWATNIFAGMPAANVSVPVPVYSIDSLIQKISDIAIPWQFIYFVFGGFFFYMMLRLLGLSWISSLIGSVIFLLIPHHIGLINAGHNTKLRAIMLTPFMGASFLYMLRQSSLFSVGLLTLALALLGRTNHYQLVYYSGIFLLFLALPYFIQYAKAKAWSKIWTKFGLLISAGLISIIIASPKMILTQQYLPYSIRGGDVETANTGTGGLDLDYATQWSFPPEEMITFVIPNFFGGTSQYKYTGNSVEQLQGRVIPGYWGKMPMTQSTEYLGILSVFLALMGIIQYWKNGVIKSMVFLSVFTLILSFGRHLQPVFEFFFNLLPLFDKFRVPSMILFLIKMTVAIFAAHGIESIVNSTKEKSASWIKTFWILTGGFILLGIIALLIAPNLNFIRPQEAQSYQPQLQEMLRSIRLELLRTDTWRVFIFIGLFAGLIYAYVQKYVTIKLVLPVLGALILIDMYTVDSRFIAEWEPEVNEQNVFQRTQVDNFILNDEDLFRVYPLGNLFGDNRWCYYHQSIGGYHAAKMASYQKMIEENLHVPIEAGVPINWNIVRMLNVKYLISTQQIQSQNVQAVGQDPDTGWMLYQLNDYLPRAWMVYNHRVVNDPAEQRKILNSSDFDPKTEAVVSQEILVNSSPEKDANYTADVVVENFGPNNIELKVSTPQDGLLVLSENYIPIWWHAYINGNEAEIYRVNTLQRGLVIPAGEHDIHFELQAKYFMSSAFVSNIFIWIIHAVILIGILIIYHLIPKKYLPDFLA
jgi:hypothetical protein